MFCLFYCFVFYFYFFPFLFIFWLNYTTAALGLIDWGFVLLVSSACFWPLLRVALCSMSGLICCIREFDEALQALGLSVVCFAWCTAAWLF